jgi:hypothetical protein
MTNNKIVGAWVLEKGKVVGDQNCARIENMIENELELINERDGG